MSDSPTFKALPPASAQLELWGSTPLKQPSEPCRTRAIFQGSTPQSWLIELAMEEDLLALRDAALIALLSHRQVYRLAHNTFLSMKRYMVTDRKLTTDNMMEWIMNSSEETLCVWYWREGYYEIDVLELILDLRYGLVSGD